MLRRCAGECVQSKRVFGASEESVSFLIGGETLFSEASTHNDARTTPSAMSFDAAHTAMTDPDGDIATVTTPASLAEAQEAIPRLPDHLVVAHILRSEYFDDPADLAGSQR
jgi:hypothetical protein